jgi:hypothetical protein
MPQGRVKLRVRMSPSSACVLKFPGTCTPQLCMSGAATVLHLRTAAFPKPAYEFVGFRHLAQIVDKVEIVESFMDSKPGLLKLRLWSK